MNRNHLTSFFCLRFPISRFCHSLFTNSLVAYPSVALVAIVTSFGGLAFADLAFAKDIHPEHTSAATPDYQVSEILAKPGVYSYDIGWQGIPVASAQILVERLPNNELHIQSKVQSARGIRWLYSLKHVSEALMKAKPFQPIRFGSRQIENQRSKYRKVEYLGRGELHARDWRGGKKGEEYRLSTNNLTLDPYSASLVAMSLPIETGKKVEFDVFNGRHRFIIGLEAGEEETLRLDHETVKAFKITPTIKKLTHSEGEKRFKGAYIWIRGGAERQIVKLASKVWIGTVTAELSDFQPLTSPPQSVEEISQRIIDPESVKTFD